MHAQMGISTAVLMTYKTKLFTAVTFYFFGGFGGENKPE